MTTWKEKEKVRKEAQKKAMTEIEKEIMNAMAILPRKDRINSLRIKPTISN